jgi:hypothetical protein
VYFAPQSRVMIYHAAATTLSCAAGVSGEMADRYIQSHDRLSALQASLEDGIGAATSMLSEGGVTGDPAKNLLAARDAAIAALTKTQLANAAFDGGVGQLRTFAYVTVNATSNRVIAGTQNLDAALAKINALAPAAPKSTTVSPPAGIGPPEQQPSPAQRAATLTAKLTSDAAHALALAGPVNDTWAHLATCGSSG